MWQADIPTRDELVQLASLRQPGLITLQLPTTPVTPQGQGDSTVLANLGAKALAELRAEGELTVPQLEEVALEIDALVDDELFWQHQSLGLLVVISPEHVWTLRLPTPVGPSMFVGDRVPMAPLLAAASEPRECLVLALAEGAVRLVDVPADDVPSTIRVPQLPTDAASHAGKASINDRSHSRRLVGSEGKNILVRQYARAVDAALRPVLAGSGLPLVLAAAEPIRTVFRSLNSYPALLDEAIETNPDRMSEQDLALAAREILAQDRRTRLQEQAALIEARRAQGMLLDDLSDLAQAALRGAVGTLALKAGHQVAGTIDNQTGVLELATEGDAIDDLSRMVLQTGGDVIIVDPEDVPDAPPMVGLLRFVP